MCLLAGHAGTGFSVISSNPTGPAPVRNLHAAFLAPRRLYNLVRGRLGHVTVLPAAPRCSYGTARQGSPQQLTCIAVCCPSAAVTCACHCHRDTAVCHGDVESAASASFLTRPLTALSFAVGASLLLLAAQPSSAEALQAVTLPALLQQKSVARQTAGTLELADASKAAFTEQDDPVNPFTLFGTTRKKFLIENLQGTKVMSRKKGFTTTTCVSGVAIGQQTKRFEALPESAKSNAADNQLCSKTTGPDLEQTCYASCAQACTAALSEYADRDSRLTGYSIDSKTKDKLAKSCTKQCTYECAKPGDKYGFAIPYRSRE